ncbi:hypothetical protein AgCh_025204 [Apium graveolens]
MRCPLAWLKAGSIDAQSGLLSQVEEQATPAGGSILKGQNLDGILSPSLAKLPYIKDIQPPLAGRREAACKNSPDSTEAIRVLDLLYFTALISSGSSPDSPAELGNKIYEMMAISLGGRWGRSEDGESEAASEDNSTGSDDSSIAVDQMIREVIPSVS